MKRNIPLCLGSFLLATQLAIAQQPTLSYPTPGTPVPANAAPEPALPKFDLDFEGGTPADLVRVIEKASGKALNAIVPIEFAKVPLPALRMRAVTVPQLFAALGAASLKTETYVAGSSGGYGGLMAANHNVQTYSNVQTGYGFRTEGPPKEGSVWFFYQNRPPVLPKPEPNKECRFYQLAPYLDTYKIEDITTAIQTGWKMLEQGSSPEIRFHPDTKLLIAVGEAHKLQLIDAALQQLAVAKKPNAAGPAPGKSAEPTKP
jgi:hypothetical protein